MSALEILLLAVGLALDAFAVSLAVGAARLATAPRPIFRLAFHFGLFQFLMPLLGWTSGRTVATYIVAWDHWLAFGLLVFIGGRMIRSGLNEETESFPTDPSRGMLMVVLAVATSIDAFAVGLSLAFLNIGIWTPSAVIGVITSTLSLLGLWLGARLGLRFGKKMEVIGGLVLVGIGAKVLVEHLAG